MEALQDTGTQAQLWMWAGIGIGLLLGGAAGGIAAWLGDARALTLGLAVFLLCMGLPAATGALRLAQGMGRVMPREWSCVCRPETCRPVREPRRQALILMISTQSARR